ncbi:hypothetical protein JCM24511_02945 [Saitozyma sp. JCM 24511]|nr:hypothetical protein JCM24511_02945 [Saitozyma sp. JCM 24511]
MTAAAAAATAPQPEAGPSKRPLHHPTAPRPTPTTTRQPGSGYLHLAPSSHHARFSALSASYPLKLLAPTPLPSQPKHLGTCYTLAYGGGLVAGDLISLRVQVDRACGLVMLTQGSTKVFKHRPGIRPMSHHAVRASSSSDSGVTQQRLHVKLEPGSMLLLLPDSVSPFRGSRYSQAQRFALPGCRTASVLILDWVNSGRGYRPAGSSALSKTEEDEEIWSMDSYASVNEVLIGDKLVMRERMVLDNHPCDRPNDNLSASPGPSAPGHLAVAARLAPYHVYATVLILGPHLAPLISHLDHLADKTSQFQLPKSPGLTWAFSNTDDQGGVLRIAGVEVEDVQRWLRGVLDAGGLRDMVGDGLWTRMI